MPAEGAPVAWALHTELDLDTVNLHLAELEPEGLLGLAEQNGVTTVYLSRRSELELPGRWEPVADRDWDAFWKAGIEPVTVGEVTILPPWLDGEVAAVGEIVLVLEPAQAFGTGHHATTTGCLRALQESDLSRRSVLDVGTGTGVLALAAARLGARRVLALDTDPLAVEAAAGNAVLNDCAVEVREGSLDAAGTETFDVVVANLDTNTLTALSAELVACLAPDGVMFLSGVSTERAHEVVDALAAQGMRAVVQAGDEWAMLSACALKLSG